MYKRCVTEQSARRQREIEAGLLSILSTVRYEDITICDLCKSLNIPRKSFYRYFSSKDGALYALIDHTIMDFSDTLLPSELLSPKVLISFFEFWRQHEPLLTTLNRNDLGGILLQRAILRATEEAKSVGVLSSSSGSDHYTITFLITGLMSMILQWYEARFRETPEEMASITAQLLLKPLYPAAEA